MPQPVPSPESNSQAAPRSVPFPWLSRTTSRANRQCIGCVVGFSRCLCGHRYGRERVHDPGNPQPWRSITHSKFRMNTVNSGCQRGKKAYYHRALHRFSNSTRYTAPRHSPEARSLDTPYPSSWVSLSLSFSVSTVTSRNYAGSPAPWHVVWRLR